MLLAVSLAINLAFSFLVSSTQVPLEPPSKACEPEEHNGLLATTSDVCSAFATVTSTVTVTATPSAVPDIAAATLDAWTEPPYCKPSLNGSQTFCVYTNATFASGRGISIVTTPQIAEMMADFLAFTDATLLDGLNQVDNPPYFSKALPGKGIGVIANRTLQRGHRVFAYSTVLIVHRGTLSQLDDDTRAELYHRAVDALPNKTKDLYMGLHGYVGTIDQVQDIMVTNAFQFYFGNDVAHNGVIPETSRMNHDCRPNVAYFFDPESLTHFSHAVRTIYPGEEITVTYIDNTVSYEKRQEDLNFSWGFDCSCSLCSSPRMFVDESDKRIDMMRNISRALKNWTENSTATVDMAETLIELYKLERLESAMGDAYQQAAMTYASFGQLYPAIKYGMLSVEYLLLTDGPVDSELLAMQEFSRDPMKHWSWMQRIIKPSEWSEFFNTTILPKLATIDDEDEDENEDENENGADLP